MGVAMELKMMAGSETEMMEVTGKLKETVGLEAEMVVGTEGGANAEAGMDLKSTVDRSGVVAGAKASARCTIATAVGDAGVDLRLAVVGTATGNGAAAVAGV